jgi:hypothetical protein
MQAPTPAVSVKLTTASKRRLSTGVDEPVAGAIASGFPGVVAVVIACLRDLALPPDYPNNPEPQIATRLGSPMLDGFPNLAVSLLT